MRKGLRSRLVAAVTCSTAILAAFDLLAAPSAVASPARTSAVHASATAQIHFKRIHIRVIAADSQGNISPRVACGGANGVIEWHSGTYPWVKSWGEAWDNCGTGTYVQIFLSYYDPAYNNRKIATAGPHSTVGFNTGQIPTELNPGNIGIAACQHAPSWSCGTTVHP